MIPHTRMIISLLLIAGTLFLLPIPHTIALRNLLLLTLMVLAFTAWKGFPWRRLAGAVGPWLLLAAWIPLQALLLSDAPAASVREYLGHFLLPLLMFLSGALLAHDIASSPKRRQGLFIVMLAPLLLHLLGGEALGLKAWWHGTYYFRQTGFTEGPDKLNYLALDALALLLGWMALRVLRIEVTRGFLAGWLPLFAVVLAGLFFTAMRLGIVVALVMMLLFVVIIAWQQRRRFNARLVAILILTLAGMGAVAGLNLEKDARWKSLLATPALVLQTHDSNHYWLDFQGDPPKYDNGKPAELSAYFRLSWYLEGVHMVRQWPLGIGFSRNAFGHGLKKRYGKGHGHSHSGWLDLTLGAGLPALALWVTGLVTLGLFAWRRLEAAPLPASALILYLAAFGFRSLVDSVLRDHMLIQFMLTAGLLSGWILAVTQGGGRVSRASSTSSTASSATSRPAG